MARWCSQGWLPLAGDWFNWAIETTVHPQVWRQYVQRSKCVWSGYRIDWGCWISEWHELFIAMGIYRAWVRFPWCDEMTLSQPVLILIETIPLSPEDGCRQWKTAKNQPTNQVRFDLIYYHPSITTNAFEIDSKRTVRAYLGLEYMCLRGHRFIAGSADRAVKLASTGYVKVCLYWYIIWAYSISATFLPNTVLSCCIIFCDHSCYIMKYMCWGHHLYLRECHEHYLGVDSSCWRGLLRSSFQVICRWWWSAQETVRALFVQIICCIR